MKIKKIITILLCSVVIISNFPISQFDVKDRMYAPSGHGTGKL